MVDTNFESLENILPIQGPMRLLDKIVSCADGVIECEVSHKSSSAFTNLRGQRPAWVGIEYVCQAILALEILARLDEGKAVKPGFIIGAKCAEFSRAFFEPGEELLVRVETQVTVNSIFGAYSGQIFNGEEEVMSAIVKGAFAEDPSSIWDA